MLFSNPVADSISIHTPLAGSDLSTGDVYQLRLYFNPHSPCGERSGDVDDGAHGLIISIHTPLAGSDRENETFLTKC